MNDSLHVVAMQTKKELGNVERLVEESPGAENRRLEPGEVDILVALYQEGVSSSYIAAKLGISKQAVCYQLKKHGVPIRPKQHYVEQYHARLFKRLERKGEK